MYVIYKFDPDTGAQVQVESFKDFYSLLKKINKLRKENPTNSYSWGRED